MTTKHFTPGEINRDPILYGLARDGLSLTRENYIIRNWGVTPDEWTAENESALPEKLQDWSAFEKDEPGEAVPKAPVNQPHK